MEDVATTFVWLLTGAAFQVLGSGGWTTVTAAWLAPIFFLRFTHQIAPFAGMLWLGLARSIAHGICLHGIVPIPEIAYLAGNESDGIPGR